MTDTSTPHEPTIQLEQQGLFAGRRRFTLKNNRYLFAEITALRRRQNYELDVLALDSRPRFRLVVAWRWILAATLVLALEIPVLRHLLPTLDPEGRYALTVIVVFTLLAFLFIVVAFAHSFRETVFVSRHAHYPLLHLLHNRPDRTRFRDFVQTLQAAIEQAANQAGLSRQQWLAGEVKTLRRLSGKGVLRLRDYERLRTKLMKMTGEA